jgi:Putative MetA-pathway of phenol degradation
MNQPTRKETTDARRRWSTRSPQPLSLAVLCSALLLIAHPARAEEPLWGEIASTLGKGFVNATTRGILRDTKPFRHHGGAVLMTMEQMSGDVSLEYGLRSDVDIRMMIPYFSQAMKEQFAGQTARHQVSGMGEMTVGAKWRFWQAMDDRHKDELALFTDVKLPTGDNNLKDANGSILPRHLQPNSGNLGATLGVAANRHTGWGGYWVSSMVVAEAPSSRYQRGEVLEMHASTGRRFRRLSRPNQTDWMGIVGLHCDWMGKDSEGGRTVRDSGGTVLFAELSLIGSKRTRGLRLGILFPVYTDLGLAHAPPRREIQASFRSSF